MPDVLLSLRLKDLLGLVTRVKRQKKRRPDAGERVEERGLVDARGHRERGQPLGR
jgi:hypothetical protein